MKPEKYATKKAIAPITIDMTVMARSSLSSGNMTRDGGISLEYTLTCRDRSHAREGDVNVTMPISMSGL